MKVRLTAKYSNLKRNQKKWIMVAADILLVPLALWVAWGLRLGDFWPDVSLIGFWWLFPSIVPVAIFIFAKLGLYRAIIRYIGSQALFAIVKGSSLMALVLWSLVFLSREPGFPRSIPIIFAMVLLLFIGGSRLFVRFLYQWVNTNFSSKEAVAIYGAGDSGIQLITALQKGKEYMPVAFFDDNPQLWQHFLHGAPIFDPAKIAEVLADFKIQRVLLATPRATKKERKLILDKLEPFAVHVQTIPSVSDIVSGAAPVDQLQEVELDDLLGRDPVPPMQELFDACIKNKVVIVTGGGGSIGSELCRQIVNAMPKKLIIFEQNEYSLYLIEQELISLVSSLDFDVQIIPILGSVTNANKLGAVFGQYSVNTVYHAAAYKHVPLVEQNVFEGIRNNIIGTKVVSELAHLHKVERFVLISTDKAVRPTNVMGASKRFAEQLIQILAQKSDTVFCMVRFGNVLGSSGSVVPKFRQQIAHGGPITVTHPEITRYFMTIPEASQLVIQAGAMALGGDVFVLDMGDPVKIVDLARRMIELSGFDVKGDHHPDGDIEIIFTGLRPGEKLFEELLIGDSVTGTEHSKILRANEVFVEEEVVLEALRQLEKAEDSLDAEAARTILQSVVRGFKPNSALVDLLDKRPV